MCVVEREHEPLGIERICERARASSLSPLFVDDRVELIDGDRETPLLAGRRDVVQTENHWVLARLYRVGPLRSTWSVLDVRLQ